MRHTAAIGARLRRHPGLQLVLLAAGLAAAVTAAAGMGFLHLPFGTVGRIIVDRLVPGSSPAAGLDPLWTTVVMDVRLPRILTAALVGGGLSVAGVVFQGILLNPLADPYTLGVSAGAAFGAALALLLELTAWGAWSVPACAFAGAGLTLLAVIYLASDSGGFSSNNLILAGIIVAAILSAGVSFIKYLADEQVAMIIFWLLGSFAAKTWADVVLVAVFLALAMAVFIWHSRDLNLIALGERSADALGVDTRKAPLILLVTASMITAVCVSVSGIIGFVGLLVPHMMRAVTGPNNRRLLPAAMLAGAILLLCADTVTRAWLPREIPIGVITALIGGPFFCVIYRRRHTTGMI